MHDSPLLFSYFFDQISCFIDEMRFSEEGGKVKGNSSFTTIASDPTCAHKTTIWSSCCDFQHQIKWKLVKCKQCKNKSTMLNIHRQQIFRFRCQQVNRIVRVKWSESITYDIVNKHHLLFMFLHWNDFYAPSSRFSGIFFCLLIHSNKSLLMCLSCRCGFLWTIQLIVHSCRKNGRKMFQRMQ